MFHEAPREMKSDRLKIAYVTRGRADDPANWSGIVKHIRDGLDAEGHEVTVIDQIKRSMPVFSRVRGRFARLISCRAYAYDRDVSYSRKFSEEVERKLTKLKVDCIVSPVLPTIAMLRTQLPIAVWDDGPFHCLRDIYPQYQNLAPDSLRQGDFLDSQTIKKASLLTFASRWAASDAINFHGADPKKIEVIPFGANCDSPFRDEAALLDYIDLKSVEVFRMLFVGIDWERKGGPLTVEILTELRRRGVNAELVVIGCSPFKEAPPEGVRCLGLLSKGKPEELRLWQDSFLDAHVFVMPTRAECFGVVYAEAAAHGLPCLATRVGGVPDAVAEEVSGWLFDLDTDASDYCDRLEKLARNRASLRESSASAYRHYLTKLNWRQSASDFTKALLKRLPHGTEFQNYLPAP